MKSPILSSSHCLRLLLAATASSAALIPGAAQAEPRVLTDEEVDCRLAQISDARAELYIPFWKVLGASDEEVDKLLELVGDNAVNACSSDPPFELEEPLFLVEHVREKLDVDQVFAHEAYLELLEHFERELLETCRPAGLFRVFSLDAIDFDHQLTDLALGSCQPGGGGGGGAGGGAGDSGGGGGVPSPGGVSSKLASWQQARSCIMAAAAAASDQCESHPYKQGGGTSSDGSSEEVQTNPDGSKTTTKTNPDGSKTTTKTNPDGSKTRTTTNPDGSTSEVHSYPDGSIKWVNTSADGKERTTKIRGADGSWSTTTDKHGDWGRAVHTERRGPDGSEVTEIWAFDVNGKPQYYSWTGYDSKGNQVSHLEWTPEHTTTEGPPNEPPGKSQEEWTEEIIEFLKPIPGVSEYSDLKKSGEILEKWIEEAAPGDRWWKWWKDSPERCARFPGEFKGTYTGADGSLISPMDMLGQCVCQARANSCPSCPVESECQSESDRKAAECLENPYDPVDGMRPECMEMLEEHNPGADIDALVCSTVQCSDGLVGKAGFVSGTSMLGCGCMSAGAGIEGGPGGFGWGCEQFTCEGGCVCSAPGQCGCSQPGGPPPGGTPMGATGNLPTNVLIPGGDWTPSEGIFPGGGWTPSGGTSPGGGWTPGGGTLPGGGWTPSGGQPNPTGGGVGPGTDGGLFPF